MAITPISLDAISNVNQIAQANKSVSSGIESAGSSFENILSGLNDSQINADEMVQKMALGEDVDLHQVMITMEENDINFKVALSIRDKLVDAYHEIMRMQV